MEPSIHYNSPISSNGSNSPTSPMRLTNNSNYSNYSNIDYDVIYHQPNDGYHHNDYFGFNDDDKSDHDYGYKPKLLSKIKAKSLDPLNESKQGKLPSPVLTKQNSKIWTDTNFDEYEKELIEQIEHLQESNSAQIIANFAKV